MPIGFKDDGGDPPCITGSSKTDPKKKRQVSFNLNNQKKQAAAQSIKPPKGRNFSKDQANNSFGTDQNKYPNEP